MSTTAFSSLRPVVDRLPFHVDDFEAANQAFRRGREDASEADEHAAELWTYCFVRRYFLIKFTRQSEYEPADLDELVEKVYQKIERGRSEINDPDRYAQWVSVICKNTFLNYVRRQRQYVSTEDEHGPTLTVAEQIARREPGLAVRAVEAAISRLPDYLEEAARLRLLEEKTYQQMGEITEKSVASLRTYVNRARKKLREDPALRAYLDPPGEP